MLNESIESILSFWFGETYDPIQILDSHRKLWFGKEEAIDKEINDRFSESVYRAAAGGLDFFKKEEKGSLALIILLDQFTRNMWRGTATMYQFDPKALKYATEVIEKEEHLNYSPIERIFLYLPFEHAEDNELQAKSVELFTQLRDSIEDETKRKEYDLTLDYAIKHQGVIQQFGRFPHRNPILKRESTVQEQEYLSQPGSGF